MDESWRVKELRNRKTPDRWFAQAESLKRAAEILFEHAEATYPDGEPLNVEDYLMRLQSPAMLLLGYAAELGINSSLKNAVLRGALPLATLDFHFGAGAAVLLASNRRLEAGVSSALGTPLRTAPLAERAQPGGAVASRPIRTRLYALPTSHPCRLTRSVPRTFTRRKPPISFIHPMHSSTRLRIFWLTW